MAESLENQDDLQAAARLDYSMASYRLKDDDMGYEFNTVAKPPKTAIKETFDTLDTVTGLHDDTKRMAKAMVLSNLYGSSRNYSRVTTVKKKEDVVRRLKDITLQMNEEEADKIITNTQGPRNDDGYFGEGGAFFEMEFGSEAEKQNFKIALLEKAYRQANELEVENAAIMAGDNEDNKTTERQRVKDENDKRKKQRANLNDAIAEVNFAKAHKSNLEDLSTKISNNLVRQTTLAANSRKDMLPAPNLGGEPYADWATKKMVTQYFNGNPFGTPNCNKSLKSTLELLIPIIESRLTKKGAVDLLLHSLGGEPKEFVDAVKDTYSFDEIFSQLQISFAPTYNVEEISKQIRDVQKERPKNINTSIAKIIKLCEERCKNLELPARTIIRDQLEKENIFILLQFWFPEAFITISSRFDQMIMTARVQGAKLKSPGSILNVLAREYLRNIQPRNVRQAEMFSLEMVTSSLGVTQDSICADIANDVSINAMKLQRYGGQQGRYEQPSNYRNFGNDMGYDRNKFNQGMGQPLKKKQYMKIPANFKNKCLKCGTTNHVFKNCTIYPEPGLAETPCSYCNAYHLAKCRNVSQSDINELDIDYEFEFVEDENELTSGRSANEKDEGEEVGESPSHQ